MVMDGLLTEEKYAALLSRAHRSYMNAEMHSVDRKAYTAFLKKATKQLNILLNTKDFDGFLKWEKRAQEFDYSFATSPETQKIRLESLTSLRDVCDLWEAGKDPEKVRLRFGEALSGISGFKLGDRQLKDAPLVSCVRTQCRRLGVFAGGTAVPGEKAYYFKRQELFRALEKEHQVHLDRAMGYSRSAPERSLGRSL